MSREINGFFLAHARELGGACFGGKQVGAGGERKLGAKNSRRTQTKPHEGTHHGRVHWHEGDANQPRTSFWFFTFCFLLFFCNPELHSWGFFLYLRFSSSSLFIHVHFTHTVSSHFSGVGGVSFFRAQGNQRSLTLSAFWLASSVSSRLFARSIVRSLENQSPSSYDT